VLIDRDQPAEFDSVRVEHAAGVGDAVRHLAELGHRRIAIISGEPGFHPTRDRLRGYREAMKACRLPVREAWVGALSFSTEAGYQETRRLLALPEPPTALIAGGSSLLPGLLAATREAGVSVPRDLSVIAGADSDVARLSTPAITAVHWPHDALGRAAGQFLMNRLAQPSAPRQEMRVRAELVVRGSCAPPAQARPFTGTSTSRARPRA
jgi:LacI family transcriptional regulator